jgi:hypothetical protein
VAGRLTLCSNAPQAFATQWQQAAKKDKFEEDSIAGMV